MNGDHIIQVNNESEDRETKGLENKFPGLREFIKVGKGRVDYMLKVDSIKTSRGTEVRTSQPSTSYLSPKARLVLKKRRPFTTA